MMPLILASASPRRFQLLGEIGVPFTVIPAEVEEHEGENLSPREMVLHNARLKAGAIATRFPDRIILAADTTVFIDERILNKPRTMDEAWAMLKTLSGRTHSVFTGLLVKGPGDPFEIELGVESRVTFKVLDDETIRTYFTQVNPMDKAGAYGIQEGTDLIIDGYEGSLSNVMGLPVEETRECLRRFGLLGN